MVYVENELIGRRLKRIRMDLGMDYPDMAELLEISDGHYRKIERGVYGLDVRKLMLLYTKLQVDPLYLLTGEQSRAMHYIPGSHTDRDTLICELLDYCKTKLSEKGD